MKTEEQKRKNAEYMRKWRAEHPEEAKQREAEWRAKNPERYKEIQQKSNLTYRQRDREKYNAINRASYHRNIEKQRARGREKARRIRMEVLNHYGLVCACCGESHVEFLSIDHINGGGSEHRRSLRNEGGWMFYRWLIKNNFPAEFQTLCFNCNMAKGLYGKCPHQETP